MAIDLIFLFDVILNFFTSTCLHQSSQNYLYCSVASSSLCPLLLVWSACPLRHFEAA